MPPLSSIRSAARCAFAATLIGSRLTGGAASRDDQGHAPQTRGRPEVTSGGSSTSQGTIPNLQISALLNTVVRQLPIRKFAHNAGVVRDLRTAARRVLAARDMPGERRRATAVSSVEFQLVIGAKPKMD